MNKLSDNNVIKKIILYGCIIRFVYLLIVLGCKDIIPPYALSDDEHYEEIAATYYNSVSGFFDFSLATSLHFNNLLQVLWTYIVCFATDIFDTIYGARIFNCLVSTYCIYLVYQLSLSISKDIKIAILAAKLYAFIPFTWMFCAFPFKDTFLSCCVLYLLILLVKWQNNEKIGTVKIIVSIFVSICIFLTRGAVVEFLGLSAFSFLGVKYYNNKRYVRLFLLLIVGIFIISYVGVYIQGAAERKLEDYGTESNLSTGNLALLQIKHLSDIWKFPMTYCFALFQPIMLKIKVFSVFDTGSWISLIGLLNISTYPIAFGNIAYVFCKKYNYLFWITTFLMYGAIICLSLGTFRHYMFLYPILLINYAFVKSYNSPKINKFIKYGSFTFLILIILMSI